MRIIAIDRDCDHANLVEQLRNALPPDLCDNVLSISPDQLHDRFSFSRSRIFPATQTLDDFARSCDPAFSRRRVRKFLFAHGLRGTVLRAEVDRITSGYLAWRMNIKQGDLSFSVPSAEPNDCYPYAWPKSAMTRLMKRMFHGHAKENSSTMANESTILGCL